ncbi:MAG: GNAT family N-acetyltransferase [Terriglobales bacterium]
MQDSEIRIRAEHPADFEAIDSVHRRAFKLAHGESVAELVRKIRSSNRYVPDFALVASRNGSVIGHILVSYTDLVANGNMRQILMLSPLGVDPEFQRAGVGSALTKEVLKLADERSEPIVVLEGNPAYYLRFGFRPARSLAIEFPAHVPEEAAQACPLSAYDSTLSGRVIYPSAFDDLH